MTAWLIVIEIEPERSQQVRKHHATKRAPPGYCSLSPRLQQTATPGRRQRAGIYVLAS